MTQKTIKLLCTCLLFASILIAFVAGFLLGDSKPVEVHEHKTIYQIQEANIFPPDKHDRWYLVAEDVQEVKEEGKGG